jgi:hypothetical protein
MLYPLSYGGGTQNPGILGAAWRKQRLYIN